MLSIPLISRTNGSEQRIFRIYLKENWRCCCRVRSDERNMEVYQVQQVSVLGGEARRGEAWRLCWFLSLTAELKIAPRCRFLVILYFTLPLLLLLLFHLVRIIIIIIITIIILQFCWNTCHQRSITLQMMRVRTVVAEAHLITSASLLARPFLSFLSRLRIPQCTKLQREPAVAVSTSGILAIPHLR